MKGNALTQDRVRELLEYTEDTGVFIWRVSRGLAKVGQVAGSKHSEGYWTIRLDRKLEYAHRLVFLYLQGYIPDEIDHINGCRHDNRACNLRPASRAENNHNAKLRKDNTSGVKGVTWHRRLGKWQAQIQENGKHVSLGCYDSVEEAARAVRGARQRVAGAFARHE